jgi:serine/threonine protein kinase/sugar lactone lactonase YvrE
MAPSEWDQVLELFHAAIDTPPEARTILLDQACGPETAIRRAVEDLLREHDSAGSFLSRPVWETAPGAELFESGKRFESFVLEEMLGRGGMGEVWSARDLELERPVALKFLRARTASNSDAARIVREAQAASALNHPNIVTIYGVVRSEGIAAIVMELVKGSSLAALRGAPVAVDKVLAIGSQIAQALKAAHERGIVHGDIKPENIVQRHDGYIKVLDFGLARRVIAEGMPAVERPGFGTMRYMSPEQARGESLTASSDIFSFGLVLYELTAGRHPFADQSPAEAMHANLDRTPPAPSSVTPRIPSALNSLILAMLAKNAMQRPSAAQVAERLDAVGSARARAGRRFWLAGALGTCVIAAAIAGWLITGRGSPQQFANLHIEPLTSQDGWEAAPAFSPDGKSVAFTWTPGLETPPQIYLKRDNDSAPVRITDIHAEGILGPPAWSPDGKRIAFKRVFKSSSAIFAIPSAGGEQKKLADLAVTGLANAIDWSPDGTHLTFSDLVSSSDRRLVIYSLNLAMGEKRRLTDPSSVEFADWDPRFSPDGRTIAFKRVGGFWDDAIYTVPASGGEARRVTWEPGGIAGHAWSRDGKSLILSCQRGTSVFGLWRFPLDRRSPPERIIQGASDAVRPAISRASGRLSWVNQNEDANIYRVASTGAQPPQSLIASTARDRDAAYSPDGRIAFVSDRSGTREIWLAVADGSDQRRVTNFNGPDIDNLAWSPDGRHLAFYVRAQGHSDIFTLDCNSANGRCGNPQLTVSGIKAQVPGWSRDGMFLYFASDRTGRFELWREPASGGRPTRITHNGGFMARESQDGKWLYFSKDGGGTLWRMRLPLDPSGASNEELVIGLPFYVQPTGWALTPDEIVFVDGAARGQSGSLRGYQIAPRVTRLILPFLRSFADNRDYNVTVSPDSKWILYSQMDRSGSNVMVAENH